MELFNLGLSFSGFSIPLVTELFILIDAGIYGIVAAAIRGFYDIIQVSSKLFGSSETKGFEIIKALINRVMILGGIYALFRVSLMLINYIIDPSKLKSAERTGIDIAKNAFIAIILLLISPFIFQKLGEFQQLIIDNNIIENVIYGGDGSEEKSTIRDNAKKFANNVWLLFFTPKGAADDAECNEKYNKVAAGGEDSNILTLIGCHYKYYDYFPIAPFIVGLLLIYYFVIYCMDLAGRMLKLLVLEVISPIPIIMSIDPSQKNRLSTFIKVYIPIYLQVFIRIITFYLAFAICSLVLNNLTLATDIDINWFLKIVIVIGVFHTMKEIPKLIEDAIGIRFGNSPGKSFGSAVMGMIGGTAGLIGGGVAGAVTGGVGGAIGGALQGAYSGWTGGASSKNAGELIKNSVATIGQSGNLGAAYKKAGGILPFMGGGLQNFFGGQNKDNKKNAEFDKQIQDVEKSISNINQSNDIKDKINSHITGKFEEKYGSLSDFMGKDKTLRDLMYESNNLDPNRLNSEFGGDKKAYSMQVEDDIKQRETKIQSNYDHMADSFFNAQIRNAKSGNDLDADSRTLSGLLNQYETFNTNAGLKRDINDYKGKNGLSNSEKNEIIELQKKQEDIKKAKKEYNSSKPVNARNIQAEYQKGGKGK